MIRHTVFGGPLGLALTVLTGIAAAQGPQLGRGQLGGNNSAMGGRESSLGPSPGSGGNQFSNAPGSDRPTLGGGSSGTSTPVAPPSISDPGGGASQVPGGSGIAATPALLPAQVPLYGPLSLPTTDDEGPTEGLTLDEAVGRLVRDNLDLKSRFFEIPQARADILTASLYANPILFFDAQLVPYGNYTRQRNGGPTQYDLNISHPLDLSGKRRARTAVACAAQKVIEAQYQDAVRLEIDNLFEAFVGAVLARESIDLSRAAVDGLDQVLETIRDQREEKIATQADVNSVLIQRELAAQGLSDAEQMYRSTKLRLGAELTIPPAEAEAMAIRGSLKVNAPLAPPAEDLVGLALQCRPDLAAYRLGVRRSQADVKLANANRLADVYVLYQPYTFQNPGATSSQGSHSWAGGVTVPLPVYNRNQGNIQRAKINVDQSKTELAAQEQRVVIEVLQAEKEYQVAQEAVDRLERVIRPAAQKVLDTAQLRFRSGEKDILYYLSARRDYNDFVRQYLQSYLRYRRSLLKLNTAVGQRIMP